MSKISFDMLIRSYIFLLLILISTPSMAAGNPLLVTVSAISAAAGAASSLIGSLVALHLSFSPLWTLLTATGTAIVSSAGTFGWFVYELNKH